MHYRIHFFGNFRLLAPDGTDLTPSSVQHRAFLALIAQSQDFRRARGWVASKLWSERSEDRAKGSFREALSQIRKGLGSHSDIITSNKSDVWLDRDRIKTDLAPDASFREQNREFLEGIDIRDPSFEEWLTEMRSKFDYTEAPHTPAQPASTSRPKGILVRSKVGQASTRAEGMTAQLVADFVATNFDEWFGSWLQANSPEALNDGSADLEVDCGICQDGGLCVIYLNVTHIPTNTVLFSGHRSFHGRPFEAVQNDTIASLAHAAATKVAKKVPIVIGVDRPESVAAGLAYFGKQRLMTFAPDSLEEAFGLMTQAQKAHQQSVFVAWQAFIRMAQLVDTVCEDREGKREELRALTSEALELSHDNSLTVALVAIARGMGEDNFDDSETLAKLALKINPMNLFARQAMALVHSAAGDINGAYKLSNSCQALLPDDDTRHLWDLYHSLVCIAAGHETEALTAAERASARCAQFNAPRRQLLGLYLHNGRIDDARLQFERLSELEPNFSLDRFLNDPEYPVDTLRRHGLVDPSMRKMIE